ncbi:MAG TPA: helix-hairpin-helix domain-containing protein [Ktedonobacterales bacterium]|nr:helix-hairpin-helix domain-containing protein [Ktedonobacterales bacterium]
MVAQEEGGAENAEVRGGRGGRGDGERRVTAEDAEDAEEGTERSTTEGTEETEAHGEGATAEAAEGTEGTEADEVAAVAASALAEAEDALLAETPGNSWAQMPDLVIVDGGRPQLNAALAVLDDLGVAVPVVGIAKEDHGSISTHEEVYLPDEAQPVVPPRGSQALYLLQRVRDEAHRFAITYHRQVRSTKTFKSVLDEIPGIGPKRKKALIRRFGSARAIAAAPLEELTAVEGINRELAERIKEHIGSGKAEAVEPAG